MMVFVFPVECLWRVVDRGLVRRKGWSRARRSMDVIWMQSVN